LTHIEEFSLSLIPFDYDLMSMEMDNSFKVILVARLRFWCLLSFSSYL
jgi:hypothetical protein